jgi:hypothetical protein
MAMESVKNSTGSKSRKKQHRIGDRENDRPGSVDPFGYAAEKEEALASDMLRGMIDEELAPTKPRLTAEEIARAIPDSRVEEAYPQWPGRINPDGSRSRMIKPDRTEDIQAGPVARPNNLYMKGYTPEDELIRQFLARSRPL